MGINGVMTWDDLALSRENNTVGRDGIFVAVVTQRQRDHDMVLESSRIKKKSQLAGHFEMDSITITGWWLYTHPSEKYELVNWDD